MSIVNNEPDGERKPDTSRPEGKAQLTAEEADKYHKEKPFQNWIGPSQKFGAKGVHEITNRLAKNRIDATPAGYYTEQTEEKAQPTPINLERLLRLCQEEPIGKNNHITFVGNILALDMVIDPLIPFLRTLSS